MKKLFDNLIQKFNNPARHSLLTSELSWVVGAFSYAHYHASAQIAQFTYCLNVLSAAYLVSRALTKKNRGQFHSGYLTSEFLVTCLAVAWNHRFAGPRELYFMTGQIALYLLCRGITKGIGVRTQTVFR